MSLSIVTPSKRRNSTHQICPHIQWNLFRFNQSMVPIHAMDSYISPYLLILSRRQVSKGLLRFNPIKSLLIKLLLLSALHSIGPVSQSLMMNLCRSLGLMTTNFNNISTGILSPSFLCWLWDRLPRLLLILSQRLQPFTFLRPPSLTVWIDCSLSSTVLGLIPLVNGDLRKLLSAT